MNQKDPVDELLREQAKERMSGFEQRDSTEMWKRFEAAHLKRRPNYRRWSGVAAACLAIAIMASYLAFPGQVRALGQRLMDMSFEFGGDRQANIGLSIYNNEPPVAPADGEYATLEDVRAVAPFPVLEPIFIPERYRAMAFAYEPIGAAGIVTIRYRSEDGGFLVFEQFFFYDLDGYGQGKVIDTDDTRVTDVDIDGAQGVLSERRKDGYVKLLWVTRTNGCQVYGHITPEEAIKIAKSVR
jgi:hypothetical protein